MSNQQQQPEAYSIDQGDKYKVEHTSVEDYVEDDRASSIVNEFGHGEGSFMTAYFNIVCVVVSAIV
jgi:hypothetical protein